MSGWQFKNLDDARALISQAPIGSASIDPSPIEIGLAPNLSFGGAEGSLAINPRGKFTIAVLNDPTDLDEDGILQKEGAAIADGKLPPQVVLDGAWFKLRAEAGVKAVGQASVAKILGLEGGADLTVVFADYRRHDPDQPTREAFLADIAKPRFITNRDHVESLETGEALAFRRSGTIRAAVTVTWSDVFTGQIGTLARLLGTTVPIMLSFKAGASVTAEVTVEDDFVIALSRVSAKSWRAGIRKARSSRIAPSVDAGISVGFADERGVEKLLGGLVDSVIGGRLAEVKALLQKASLEALSPAERRIALALMERLGLQSAVATLESLAERVAEIENTAAGLIKDVARARIALSFAYEYARIEEHVNLLQVTLDKAGVAEFHADIVRGTTLPLTEGLAKKQPGLVLESYLNQRTITSEHSWGFTLSFGKWASIGGKDFKQLRRVERLDIEGRTQQSYLGARGYKGSWAGDSFEWHVDLRADMKSYAREPLVSDFSFGMHVGWLANQKKLSPIELEQWLDMAAIWGAVSEVSLPDVRARMSRALGRDAQVTMQIVVPNAVMRSALPRLAAMTPEDYAGALAAAMPWMEGSRARTDARLRRSIYEPLWAVAMAKPNVSTEELGRLAGDRLRAEGHPEMVVRERAFLDSPDPFSFAGLVRINGNSRASCAAFSRGARVLQAAIEGGARNLKTIDKAIGEMNDLWTQSHHVRAVGVQLLEIADQVGQLGEVTRTMTFQSKALTEELVLTA